MENKLKKNKPIHPYMPTDSRCGVYVKSYNSPIRKWKHERNRFIESTNDLEYVQNDI